MSARAMAASTAIKVTSDASSLSVKDSIALAVFDDSLQKAAADSNEAVNVVTNMNTIGINVTQMYFSLPDFIMTVVPTPR